MKKVLVIDDSQDIVTLVTNILQNAGYEVSSTTFGRDAYGLAKQFNPDLIILDIEIPDLDGAKIASFLSEDPATANIPIIFFSCYITKDIESTGRKQPGRYVLSKPVNVTDLLKAVSTVLSKTEENQSK